MHLAIPYEQYEGEDPSDNGNQVGHREEEAAALRASRSVEDIVLRGCY